MRLAASTIVVCAMLLMALPTHADGVRNDKIDAEATVGGGSEPVEPDEPGPTVPPPRCWWESQSASPQLLSQEQSFWRHVNGGDHADDVVVFIDNGTLRRSFSTTQKTYVLRVRACSDPTDTRAGTALWAEVGPPNPTVYWDELTERVTRRVPLPDPNLGVARSPDGSIRVAVQLGLWLAVDNADDIVARVDPTPGVWAETRAELDRIEFDTGTGTTVTDGCDGPGTPLPPDIVDTADQGTCGYTYTRVDELGEHTAIVRAIWTVTNTASTGATEQRPDIVLETPIAIEVFEVQAVGSG